MAGVIRRTFFEDIHEDAALADRNAIFWRSLLGHIEADRAASPGCTILDWGCHRGGLLSLAVRTFHAARVYGIEPLLEARRFAEAALGQHDVDSAVLPPGGISTISASTVDIVLSHEVFYLLEDLAAAMQEIARVLTPGGSAYIVLGCHTENPIWPTWKRELQDLGHKVFDHAPLELLRAGADAGLSPALRPLRTSGWVHYDPRQPGFGFPTVDALLDHQFKHKLLFRFVRP